MDNMFLHSWLTEPAVSNISVVSSGLSLIGLIVTIFLYIEARDIRRYYLRKTRFSEIKKELVKQNTLFNESVKAWPEVNNEAPRYLKEVRIILKSYKDKSALSRRFHINHIIFKIYIGLIFFKFSEKSKFVVSYYWDLYSDIAAEIASIEEQIKDIKRL